MRRFWLGLVLAVVVAGAFSLLAMQRPQTWTTDEPAALREFEAGLEDVMRVYRRDAAEHFVHAVELDPDFLVARLFAVENSYMLEPERRLPREMFEELHAADLSTVTPRERFLLRFHLALQDGAEEEAKETLESYLEEHPHDSFALNAKLDYHWKRGELEQAEEMARELIEVDPNNAIAYNHLGYLAMGQGRFTESEEMFVTYRFLAPDQANPHDSLGELYLLVGRYDEARASFERAVAIRPDFVASYEHLVVLAVEQGEFDEAVAVVERMRSQKVVDEKWLSHHDAYVELWRNVHQEGWRAGYEYYNRLLRDWEFLADGLLRTAHLVACKVGDIDLARELEDQLVQRYEKKVSMDSSAPVQLTYLRSLRHAATDELASAISGMHSVDKRLSYQGSQGRLKLCNRLHMASVLQAIGDTTGSAALRRQVDLVNPEMGASFDRLGCSVVQNR